jgi:alkylhydroperoxidase family enzyme
MPRIERVDPGVATDPTVAELAKDPFYGVLAHRPDILIVWAELDRVFFGPTSALPNTLKEEARRTLSQQVGCRLCASLGEPRDEHPDHREALAVAFADLVAKDHQAIDDSTFRVLHEEFSEEEIVELVAWVCFKYGSNMFGNLMRLDPATDDQVRGYADFVATG